MQYVLDPEGKVCPNIHEKLHAKKTAGNRIVTTVHLSMIYSKDSVLRWVYIQVTWPVGRYLYSL
jgi:hypothetical protein